MCKRAGSCLFFLLSFLAGTAQNGPKYQLSLATGLLQTEGLPWFQVQAVNAISYSGFSLGLGIGSEYFEDPGTLLFVDVQKAFGNGRKNPFVYLDAGHNYARRTESDRYEFVTAIRGGVYGDAGIGYQLPVSKKLALFFTAGYSVKEFSTTGIEAAVIAVYPPPPPHYYDTGYKRKRFGFKAGLRF